MCRIGISESQQARRGSWGIGMLIEEGISQGLRGRANSRGRESEKSTTIQCNLKAIERIIEHV